ncbi:hypothetical protein Fcan01_16041 [Folsomia candida]|uniref:Helix-turn-helix domain-containing protein n=1 Tax=Folsomia candida TaxID=158441 RepID=A0A226DYZ5_FOLCA|nr:hypothetical protein Fcan01_16041 [Folsomia candida]
MFTEEFFEKFGNTVKFGNIFSYPFLWNGKTRRLHFSQERSANAIMVFLGAITFAIFMFGQTIKFKILGNLANYNLTLLGFYGVVGANLSLLMLAIKGKDLASLMNTMYLYGIKFNDLKGSGLGPFVNVSTSKGLLQDDKEDCFTWWFVGKWGKKKEKNEGVKKVFPSDNPVFPITSDVNQLYTVIPHADGLIAAKFFFDLRSVNDPPTHVLIRLLELVLTLNAFHFNSEFYSQISGVAMGAGPTNAYSRENIDIFLNAMSQIHPALKFDTTVSTNSVPFLDVEVSFPVNHLRTTIYYKPTDSHSYLPYDSCHPKHMLDSIPYSQFLRLKRICSDHDDFISHSATMCEFFQNRGCPHDLLLNALNKVKDIRRNSLLVEKVKSQKNVLPLVVGYCPFVNPVINKTKSLFKSILSKNNIFINKPVYGYRRAPNLKQLLVRSQLKPISDATSNVVPKFGTFPCLRSRCKTCNFVTQQPTLKSRWWSHPKCEAAATFNQTWVPIATLVNATLNLTPIILFLHVLCLPRHPTHFPNLFPLDTFIYRVVYMVYAPSYIYVLFHWASFTKTYVLGFAALTVFLLPLLKEELRCANVKPGGKRAKRKYQCAHDLACPENVAVTFRGLQLITKQLSFACGPFMPMVQALFGQISISAGYIVIVEWDRLDTYNRVMIPTLAVMIAVSWAAFLTFAGKIHKSSVTCVRSWKHGEELWSRSDAKYMGKFRKSCKPLFFGYPGIMTITQKTVAKFVQGIVRGVFRTVLALKN